MILSFKHLPRGSIQGAGGYVFRHYGAETPVVLTHLCFTAEQANSTISMQVAGSAPSISLETSIDGMSWTPFVVGTTTIALGNIGDKVYFRGNNTAFSNGYRGFNNFVMTGKIASSGNIMSLLDANSFENNTTISSDYCFYSLFYNCTSLTLPPELPADTLTESCYESMFEGCRSLTIAPELPATTLANSCYFSLFSGCRSLTLPPELLADTLDQYCYAYMFFDCTSLISTPELPADTLAESCYEGMFYNCTSLTSLPELPADALVDGCYAYMFEFCTGIELSKIQDSTYTTPYRIPANGGGTDASDALESMFANTGGSFKGTPTINTTYYGAW